VFDNDGINHVTEISCHNATEFVWRQISYCGSRYLNRLILDSCSNKDIEWLVRLKRCPGFGEYRAACRFEGLIGSSSRSSSSGFEFTLQDALFSKAVGTDIGRNCCSTGLSETSSNSLGTQRVDLLSNHTAGRDVRTTESLIHTSWFAPSELELTAMSVAHRLFVVMYCYLLDGC
jgi:hypothetical protein